MAEPVTADDVVFTMQLYNSPSAAVVRQNNVSPFAGFKEGDDSLQVKAVDEHTVEMTCAEPTNMDFLFFIKFRDIYILPKHLLGDTPYADIRNNSLLGETGRFRSMYLRESDQRRAYGI